MHDRVSKLCLNRMLILIFGYNVSLILRENIKKSSVDIGLPVDFRLIDDISSKVLMAKEFDQFDFSYYKPIGGIVLIDSSIRS